MGQLAGRAEQAGLLEGWLCTVLDQYPDKLLAFDAAQVWGWLRAPNPEHTLDRQIAATALVHDLTVVTRNAADIAGTGMKVIDPFVTAAPPRRQRRTRCGARSSRPWSSPNS